MSTLAIIELTAAALTFVVLAAASYVYTNREERTAIHHGSTCVVE